MSSPDQISDDDESFEQVDLAAAEKVRDNNEIIDISSDDTVDYYTSDDEELPTVNVKRSAVIKNLFPTKPAPGCSTDSVTTGRRGVPSKTNTRLEVIRSFKYNPTSTPLPYKTKVPGFEKMIGGVNVKLPVEPYGSQTVLMFKLITAINKYQNCLLESPTGSGKTLALLCGALGWLQQEQNRVAQSQAQQLAGQFPELSDLDGAVDYIASPSRDISLDALFATPRLGVRSIYDKPNQNVEGSSHSKRQEPMQDCCDESSSNGDVKIHKKRKLNGTPENKTTGAGAMPSTPEKPIQVNEPRTPEEIRVPTIYYGARTHKQLQQVIKEFSRTAYCGGVKMTVLSSRDHSCIREFDRGLWKSKNDMCRGCTKKDQSDSDRSKKKEETNCKYYNNRQALDHSSMPPAFDLEDLVAAGQDKMACPYYAARDMAKTAHIVFCPYNYLIEPGIRSSLSISLKNNIVIIDEAHNIEDICRDAASCTISWDTVKTCITEMEVCTNYRYANADALNYFDYLLRTLRNWDQWFNNQQPLVSSKPVNNNESVHTWEVEHFATTLNNHNIGEMQYREFTEAAQVFIKRLRENPGSLYGVTQITGTLVETLDLVLGYIFREAGRFKDDFKPVLVRAVAGGGGGGGGGELAEGKKWRSSQFDKWVEKDNLSLRLLCLNPGVVFSLVQNARCVILASGTLTPLVSLHSELQASFPLQVSPNHVIASDRVWIGTLSTCPDGSSLECSARHTSTCSVQDALGATVLHVCTVTPHGVLCFVPSYSLLNKLHDRWEETGLWKKLTDQKHVFMECRNSRDHNDIMEDYYKYVSTSKGALLFAVYRGKVSEGMDFKDHQARAVITVGVPFPNMHDLAVQEKMRYNDRYCAQRGLLPSREWLRVQAYRALNQAVGRCVRHRRDWGAVLLVDARFKLPYYTEHLSKWVRAFLGDNHHTYNSLVHGNNNLKQFMQHMTQEDSEDI